MHKPTTQPTAIWRSSLLTLSLGIMLLCEASAWAAPPIKRISDLSSLKLSAQARNPVVVFATASDCQYCETLRLEVMQHFVTDTRFHLRELIVNSPAPLIDFDGKQSSHSLFADELGVVVTPTVFFLSEEGETLAPALVGLSNLDYYNYYFEQSVTKATQTLVNH